MAWRSLLIQNPADLKLRRQQIRLSNETGDYTLPVEDITVIILDTPQISLSAALLAFLQDNGIVVITCDARHMPNGILYPFQPHSRQTQVAHLQTSWSKALRKRLWQRVVRAKIALQGDCLHRNGLHGYQRLQALAGHVKSGDPDNVEAQAARYYWPRLFDSGFHRGADDNMNAALNYGYAVMRACMARALVAYGFIPAFGIHHNSTLNAYNLADDLLEVLRPFVDDAVRRNADFFAADEGLSTQARQYLAGLATQSCNMNGDTHTITTACEMMAAGLARALRENDSQCLPLPAFTMAADED